MFQARSLELHWGKGWGLHSRMPPNPYSLERRESRVEGRHSLYFLLFYIPTSFRFSELKLKICIILPWPKVNSLFHRDPGRHPRLRGRPSVNNAAGERPQNRPLTSSREAGYSGDRRARVSTDSADAPVPGAAETPEPTSHTCGTMGAEGD